jgi:MoaA/NifB/PqqE/SkfB family radical SAM enzyme
MNRKHTQALKSILLPLLRFINHIRGNKTIVKNAGLEEAGKKYNSQRFYGPQQLFCYAPFRSIFVSYNGKVSPCYACKAEASIKNNSLEEIWNGDVFENLREQFKAGIIPDECSFCRGHLKNENYGSILASKYDHHSEPNKGFPSIVEFELGNKCNLECIMCCGELSSTIRSGRENKSPVESIVDDNFYKQFDFCLPNLRAAEFTGGDPFLIPAYEQIWNQIEKINPGIDILITTNANTMNENVRTLLSKNLRLSFNVSIDSLQKQVYEQIRQNAVFENAIQNIGIFSDYSAKHNTSMGFLVCPLQINRNELPDFIAFADKYNASLSYHVVFKPAELALWTMNSQELKSLHLHLEKFRFKRSDFIGRVNSRNYDGLVSLVKSWSEKAFQREKATLEKTSEIEELISIAKKAFWNKLSAVVNEDEDLQHHVRRIEHLVSVLEVHAFKELVFIKLAEITGPEVLQALNTLKDHELTQKLVQYHNSVYYQLFAGEGLSDNDKYELSMKGLTW